MLIRARPRGEKVTGERSLDQTRLDVIVQGDPSHAEGVHEVRRILKEKPHLRSSSELTARLEMLESKIAELEPRVQKPDPATKPDDWLSWRQRLGRWEGQRFAIRLVLTGSFFGVGSEPSTSTPDPAPEDWTNDPFHEE